MRFVGPLDLIEYDRQGCQVVSVDEDAMVLLRYLADAQFRTVAGVDLLQDVTPAIPRPKPTALPDLSDASILEPARVAPAAREVGAPLTADLRGPFSVWTRNLLKESPGFQEPGLSGSEQEVPGPRNRESAGDGLQKPRVGEVPGPRNRPKKENSQKKTLREKQDFLAPLPPRGDAAGDHLGEVS